jgi:hypothetical protein
MHARATVDHLQPRPGDESDAAQTQVLDDLNMLVRTGGCARRESELRELFATAELRVTNVAPLGFARSVVKAMRVTEAKTKPRLLGTDAPLELANRWPYANCIEILGAGSPHWTMSATG